MVNSTAETEAPPATDLEHMFRQHHAMVFRTAYRVTGNAGDAEDVLQTVFLRLVRRQSERDAITNAEAYLRRAAVHAALDVLQKRRNEAALPLWESAGSHPDLSTSPDRAQADGEIRQWLRQAIARLSPTAAEMFVLRYFEEKDNPEIARLLNTSEGTVAVTLHRARERIQKEYRSCFGPGR